jgi:protein-disulfide isomerase
MRQFAGALCSAVCAVLLWTTAAAAQEKQQSLPGIDLSGLTASQKSTALKAMHDRECSCKCGMKVDECRVADPSCSYSVGLAQTIVSAVKAGKNEKDALAAADASKFAHVEGPKLLDDAVQIPVTGAPVTGPANAPITLVEFSDFQCPYCATAVGEIANVLKAYPTSVKLIFKQFPLETHPQAAFAAAASLAAQRQGKFWQMHDALFAHRNDLSRASIEGIAKGLGLDMTRFGTDVASTEVQEQVIRDVQDGDQAGVQGTPTVFINGQRYNGSLDLESLKPVLVDALKRSTSTQTASARP